MNNRIDSRLGSLLKAGSQNLLQGGLKGLEKESLRVNPGGQIAQTPHPAGLGSALKHPYITTDYSEALIELITPPFADAADTLQFLDDLHVFVYRHIGEEALWAASMPCRIDGEESIPIAYYGESNSGKMKHVYRRGLAWRYGRPMQAIAGIHFNYSVNEQLWPVLRQSSNDGSAIGDFITAQYFGLLRNIQRHGWLVLYLFGASPAFDPSFLTGREGLASSFSPFAAGTLHRPFATSLRMSDIGYRNDSQSGLDISFNNLHEYVKSLVQAIRTPYPAYQQIGVKVEGEYRQLSENILQISNEYYSQIRPKQIARSGESPTIALKRRGIRYIELRSLDLGMTHPLGLDLEIMRWLETFLLCCLLRESPPMDADEKTETSHNMLAVACCGRTPDFVLARDNKPVKLTTWAAELFEDMQAVAVVLDEGQAGQPYQQSLEASLAALEDSGQTPSAKILAQMRDSGESFQGHALRLTQQHAASFRARALSAERAGQFSAEASESWLEQQKTERNDKLSFEEFLAQYFSQVE